MSAIKRKSALSDNLIPLSNKDWSKELEQLIRTWNLGKKVMFITGDTDCGDKGVFSERRKFVGNHSSARSSKTG